MATKATRPLLRMVVLLVPPETATVHVVVVVVAVVFVVATKATRPLLRMVVLVAREMATVHVVVVVVVCVVAVVVGPAAATARPSRRSPLLLRPLMEKPRKPKILFLSRNPPFRRSLKIRVWTSTPH